MDANDQPKLTVKYPRFKGGEAAVKELKLKSDYGNAAVAKFQNNVCSLKLYIHTGVDTRLSRLICAKRKSICWKIKIYIFYTCRLCQ